jgi:hypothetical protein
MSTGSFSQAGSHSQAHPSATVVTREAGLWFLARVADGHEATFDLEVDERFWRARRAVGAASSSFEVKLPSPLSPGDLAAAMVRWSAGVGLAAKVSHDGGAFRVTLSRPAD